MSEVKHFRDRATDCRNLASSARTEVDRSVLENLAAELDAEADKIEAEAPTDKPIDAPGAPLET